MWCSIALAYPNFYDLLYVETNKHYNTIFSINLPGSKITHLVKKTESMSLINKRDVRERPIFQKIRFFAVEF